PPHSSIKFFRFQWKAHSLRFLVGCSTLKKLNNKHRKVLRDIFEHPPRSDLEWKKVENLLIALGATVREGRGSRVSFFLNDRVATFHRPHPERVMNKGSIKSLQEYLRKANISPDL
ncbi:MAG: type II toxin-antitoxin system HicA family toxin, partial [Prochlorotrichaceae cyanobacterium]